MDTYIVPVPTHLKNAHGAGPYYYLVSGNHLNLAAAMANWCKLISTFHCNVHPKFLSSRGEEQVR